LVLRQNDLNPDGIRIRVNWEHMLISYSVFILCINTRAAVKQIKDIAKRMNWSVETRVVIEEGRLGVRVWRVS
jgi:hypothetical protein